MFRPSLAGCGVSRPTRYLGGLLAILITACSSAEQSAPGPQVSGEPIAVEGAHEHGVLRLGFAVDGARLTLDLEAPGDAVFGFEHAPGSDEERAKVRSALERLQANAGSLLALAGDVLCNVDGVEILEAPNPDADPVEHHDEGEGDHGHEDHDEAGDHDADQHEASEDHEAHDEVGHSEVRMRVVWNCTESPERNTASLKLGQLFPDAQLVDLTVITSEGQAAGRVNAQASFRF